MNFGTKRNKALCRKLGSVVGRNISPCAKIEKMNPSGKRNSRRRRSARETGITPDQALTLIELLGTDRSSLLREANILKNRKPPSSAP